MNPVLSKTHTPVLLLALSPYLFPWNNASQHNILFCARSYISMCVCVLHTAGTHPLIRISLPAQVGQSWHWVQQSNCDNTRKIKKKRENVNRHIQDIFVAFVDPCLLDWKTDVFQTWCSMFLSWMYNITLCRIVSFPQRHFQNVFHKGIFCCVGVHQQWNQKHWWTYNFNSKITVVALQLFQFKGTQSHSMKP